jgi:hypothetical protein
MRNFLKADYKRFESLVRYVAKHSLKNRYVWSSHDANSLTSIEVEVREHYEQMIVESIWPMLWNWFAETPV